MKLKRFTIPTYLICIALFTVLTQGCLKKETTTEPTAEPKTEPKTEPKSEPKTEPKTEPVHESSMKLSAVEPSKLERYGKFPLKIHSSGTEFVSSGATVKFGRGGDTLRFTTLETLNDTTLSIVFPLEAPSAFGTWDVVVESGKHRLRLAEGFRVVPPDPWMSAIDPSSMFFSPQGGVRDMKINLSGASLDMGPISFWLERGPLIIEGKVLSIEGETIRGKFYMPDFILARDWDLVVSQPWYRISKAVELGSASTNYGLLDEIDSLYKLKAGVGVQFEPSTIVDTGLVTLKAKFQGIHITSLPSNVTLESFRIRKSGTREIKLAGADILNDSTVNIHALIPEGAPPRSTRLGTEIH